MPHRAHAPTFSSFKLSNVRHPHLPRPPRNEWLASDRSEKMWQLTAVTIVVTVFTVGVALIVLGLTR